MSTLSPLQVTKSALFVDSDNVLKGLKKADLSAATAFATNPEQWVDWLERGMPRRERTQGTANHDDSIRSRRVLMRLCYLNPMNSGEYRADFIKAGFRVVDCPPLTKQGKNSAEIFMVLDILEALNHSTYFDEFIILSGDTDFTPVLLRLRDHDRRIVVVSIGNTPTAYSACCERLVDDSEFIENALDDTWSSRSDQAAIAAERPRDIDTLQELARLLADAVTAGEAIEFSQLPAVFKKVPEFRNSTNWLGFETLVRLTHHVVSLRDDLHVVSEGGADKAVARREPAPKDVDSHAERWAAVSKIVTATLEDSANPVPIQALVTEIDKRMGDEVRESDCLGTGGYTRLIEMLMENLPLELTAGKTRLIFDPRRHARPDDVDQRQLFEEKWPDLFALAKRISRVTDTPLLNPNQYAFLFKQIAAEFDEKGDDAYRLNRTSGAVRDRCLAGGPLIGRNDVTFVLRLLQYSEGGFTAQSGMSRAASLAKRFAGTVTNRCENAQMKLDQDQCELIVNWFNEEC